MAALDFPASPTAGQLFQAPNGSTYRYAASPARWLSATGPTSIFTGTSPPVSPAQNALWWDSDGGNLYIWYDDGNTQQWVPAWAMNVLPNSADLLSAEDNLLINGDFRVAQRATSFSLVAGSSGNKVVDKWKVDCGTGSTVTVGQNTAVGSLDQVETAVAVNRTVTGSAPYAFYQLIEDVRTAEGQTVTLSFQINCPVATSVMQVQLQQYFGSGGSPSTTVSLTPVNFTINAATTWERKTVTFVLPTTVGKTLGTNNDHFLNLIFWVPTSVGNGIVSFANVDLRLGSLAPTKFLRRPMQQELALCQRYYQLHNNLQVYCGLATTGMLTFSYPVRMRTTPTATPLSVTYSSASALAVNYVDLDQVRLQAAISVNGGWANCNITLDAEL